MSKVKINRKFKIVFLQGKKIILRPLEAGDITKRYLSWINDPEVNEYMETRLFPTSLTELKDFYNKISKSKTDVIFAIEHKKNGLHIGNIKLGGINWIHRYVELGIMIGDKRYWARGYGQEACRLALEYAFNKLNLNKVLLGTYATHKLAIKAYKKSGFKVEGRISKLLKSESRYVDKVLMGISQNEFKKRINKHKE